MFFLSAVQPDSSRRASSGAGLLLWVAIVSILASGCAGGPPAASYDGGTFLLYAEGEDAVRRKMAEEGELFLTSLADRMNLPVPDTALSVYVFDSGASMRRYLKTHCPKQQSRGAACFSTGAGYTITLVRRHREEDAMSLFRHELTHYLLISNYREFPPWVDEGLAQYFEGGEVPLHREGEGFRRKKKAAFRATSEKVSALFSVPHGGVLTREQYRLAASLVWMIMEDPAFGMEAVTCFLETVRADGRESFYAEECLRAGPADLVSSMRNFFTADSLSQGYAPLPYSGD